MRAFVALDPETRQRIGVAWSELDAYTMLKAADEKVGGVAELAQVEVSRTPEQMREARSHRARIERHEAERARVAALLTPPPGYTLRREPPLSEATLRRRFYADKRLLKALREADGWTPYAAMPYGQDTIPHARRGYIVIADPPTPSKPRLYRITPKGERLLASMV